MEYKNIEIDVSAFKDSVSGKDVPMHTAMKLAEIIRNKQFLDKLFNQIIDHVS